MRPTRLRDLALVAVLVAIGAALVVRSSYGDLPPLPRVAPFSLVLLALAELAAASSVRERVQARTRPLQPLQVARTAALAKASSLAGAIFLGGWGGALVYLGTALELSAARRDALTAGFGVLASLGLIGAALWLERCCRTPEPPREDEDLRFRA